MNKEEFIRNRGGKRLEFETEVLTASFTPLTKKLIMRNFGVVSVMFQEAANVSRSSTLLTMLEVGTLDTNSLSTKMHTEFSQCSPLLSTRKLSLITSPANFAMLTVSELHVVSLCSGRLN